MLIKDIVINENTYLQQKGFDVLTERPDNLSFLLRYVQNSIKLEVDYFIEERDNEIFVAIYYTDEGTSCVTDKKSFWENYDKKRGRFGVQYNPILSSNKAVGNIEWFIPQLNAIREEKVSIFKQAERNRGLVNIYAKFISQYITNVFAL